MQATTWVRISGPYIFVNSDNCSRAEKPFRPSLTGSRGIPPGLLQGRLVCHKWLDDNLDDGDSYTLKAATGSGSLPGPLLVTRQNGL